MSDTRTRTGLQGVESDSVADAFLEQGFARIERLLAPAALAELREAYDAILRREVEAPGDRYLGGLIRQVMNPHLVSEVFRDNPALQAAKEVAREIFEGGEPARLFDMWIDKGPGCPDETPWHQDLAYAEMPFLRAGARSAGHRVLQFWIALDDVDEETGCMTFVPGVHRDPLLPHHVAAGDPAEEHRLLAITDPERSLPLRDAVACPLPAGGATIHAYSTPHYTGPNRSRTRPRRAYIVNLLDTAKRPA